MHVACLDFAEGICNMEAGSVKRVAFVTMICSEKTFFFLLASCPGNLAGYMCFV
jgi:hypothetical protein